MGQKFFQVGYNKFYPRIVSPGMTEVSVSDTGVQVIKIVNDNAVVEEVSSTEPIQFTQRVGREKWEEIFSSFKVPPTTFLGDMVVETPISSVAISIKSDVKFIRSSVIYSTVSNPIREDSGLIRIENSQSTISFSNIEESGILRVENINSVESNERVLDVGSSIGEDMLSVVAFENEQSIGSSATENFLSKYSPLLSPSIDVGGSENFISSKFIRFSPTVSVSKPENILSNKSVDKTKSIGSSGLEDLFSSRSDESLMAADNGLIDIIFSEPTITFEKVQSIDVSVVEYISSTAIDAPPLGSAPDSTNIEISFDDRGAKKVNSSIDGVESELTLRTQAVSDRSSVDLSYLEELTSKGAAKLIELVDRYMTEELSSISLSNELHTSLRNVLIEQTAASLMDKIQQSTDGFSPEVIVSGPPIPDYGMGIGALLKKIFVETAVVPSKSILFRKIFIERAVVDITYLYTTLYLNNFNTELSFTQAFGYGNTEYLNEYTVEVCVPEEGKFTNEYLGNLFVEVSF